MTSDTVHSTRPVLSTENELRKKFVESVAAQSDLMDKLAQQLITLELAIPGLYATALKLTAGEAATVPADFWFYAAFTCWFAALILTLISLIPRRWEVDPTVLKRDPGSHAAPLGLEDFYHRSAAHKRRLLIPSILLFAAGIFAAALSAF